VYSREDLSRKKSAGDEKKRTQAVALGYDPGKDIAPRVLASGQGVIAEQIIATAKANGIIVREDPLLAVALANVEIDTFIPPELYALVAEVLAYAYRVQYRKI
jgi:flagellar biosynthesis protein